MTREEIKEMYSMRSIVEQYGLHPNRSGFIRCPFHKGDNSPSMKIYKDSYHCFACGANGDIFSFIQEMDHCDFKTAFQGLGGTYQEPTFGSRLAVYRLKKQREERAAKEERLRQRKKLNSDLIDVYRDAKKKLKPYSDAWCDCCRALDYQMYLHEVLSGEEVRK